MSDNLAYSNIFSKKQSRVKILSDQVANQIAAGEVVERPASVVKEIIENSIDAGSTEITLIIANGGKTAISVIDNGCGMDREDALLAIERFGTSKISELSDLDNVNSLGFRGEALPSIASVSRFYIQTSTVQSSYPDANQDSGTALFIEGGKLRDVRPVSKTRGTIIEVKNLFFNAPARRKFLRSELTEKGLIKAIFIDLALTRPDIHFRFVSDGMEEICLPPSSDLFLRAADLQLIQPNSLRIATPKHMSHYLFAVLSQPAEAITSSAKMRLIVNGRAIRDNLLLKAIREGYGNFLKTGYFPSGVIDLRLPPSDIDVNVHPRKTEVRFRKANEVFALISGTIRDEFAKKNSQSIRPIDIARIDSQTFDIFDNRQSIQSSINFPSAASSPCDYLEKVLSVNETQPPFNKDEKTECVSTPVGSLPPQTTPTPITAPTSFSLTQSRFVGQVFNCYLIFDTQQELVVVDMHAAHERIMYYTIKSRLFNGQPLPSQLLVSPQLFDIEEDKIEAFERSLPALQQLGFDCERFGPTSLLIRGFPVMLQRSAPEALLRELTSLPFWDDWSATLKNRLDEVVARLACHASVRSGRTLERDEVYQLIATLEQVESSGLCPHGRPVLIRISKSKLESFFAR